ncbi:SCO7613 C-terminal domain-containing membrane protein [Micromonospora sp. GCM10011542]|uniref:SCO7613 C-terminal domain-containing membrane protein n=1 Tax=Micromonospora sp. GCM10011542 TaxID=3317337 RepID=UPI00360CED68
MDDTGYPCPACGSPASLSVGCPGCGRAPNPDAAEVIRLGREIARLGPEVEQARRTYTELAARLDAGQRRRAELAALVRAEAAGPVRAGGAAYAGEAVPVRAEAVPPPGRPLPSDGPVAGVPGVPAGGSPAAGGAETSTRTVQGLLFVLGGLLLGTAAVVFTAVAWAAVGVGGRALILAAVTALALAAPLVAARRGLRGTAETFAAVGLLLVVLDGYAAWMVDLAGVAGWPGSRYAALVGGVSAAVAAGYARYSRLTGPWFAALVAAQPVLPLLAAEARPGPDGWALVLVGVALGNLAVLVGLHDRDGRRPAVLAGRVLAWTGNAAALVAAAGGALVPLVLGRAADSPLLAGAPLLLVALTGLGSALLAGGQVLRTVAAGLVPVLAAALLRPVAELRPSLLLLASATVAVVLAGAVRLLPAGWRTGPRVGSLLVAAGAAQVAVLITGALAVAAAARSVPPWRVAGLGPELDWGWQLPVAVPLIVAAAALLLPRGARPALAAAGAALTLLAVPAAWPAGWPAVLAVDLVGAAVLLLAVRARPTARPAVLAAGALGGAVLLAHGLLVGLAAPAGALAALGTVTALGLGLATARVAGPYRRVAGAGLLTAQLALPAAAAVALFAAGAPPWWQARAALIAAGLPLLALLAARRYRTDLTGYAALGAAVAVLASGLGAVVVPGDEPVPLYAALAALGLTFVARRVGDPAPPRVAAAALAAVTTLAVLPELLTALIAPYGDSGRFWSGVPTVTAEPAALPAGLALAALAPAAALAGRWFRPPALAALPFAGAALPVLLLAVGAPWPLLPAATLLAGLAALLVTALTAPRIAPIAVPVGTVLAVAGTVGLLATRAGTLAAEGVLLVAAVAVGFGARALEVRLAGCLAAVTAATALAVTAPLAGGLPRQTAAYPVLLVAVLVLAVAAVTTAPPTVPPGPGAPGAPGSGAAGAAGPVRVRLGRVLDAAAQAVALVALLLTHDVARPAATVCVLWGAAVGLRLLRRGEPAGRRWLFAGIAGGSELLGAWLLLAAGGVTLVEAYTLPAAGLALGAGLVALRTRPGLTSWSALGPGLAAALLPSLVSVLAAPEPQPWRRLLLGAAALGAVLVGATRRWQAPVLLGGAVLAALALHEVARGWDLLPRWIYLAVGGLALIGLAATYERRRRDLARLRAAVTRLG